LYIHKLTKKIENKNQMGTKKCFFNLPEKINNSGCQF